jgi:hypothetical protein
MKKINTLAILFMAEAFTISLACNTSAEHTETPAGPVTGKILVAYFLWNGNTGTIAQAIRQKQGPICSRYKP